MLTLNDIHAILADVEFEGWDFDLLGDDLRPMLQVAFVAPDADTGEPALQKGRKWFLSPHMTRSEVVATALKAVLTAIEHEARERFLYRGRAVFGPHHDVDALWRAARYHDLRQEGAA